ncbi:DNA polymerase Y family protein [Chitinophagaceae bacterium MMS25-I14]
MARFSQNKLVYNPQSVVMYVDMNSFFASCEQQDNEALRGKPIGVCTYMSPNACVIAPSTEAKKFGVKTGMRFNECLQLCPEMIQVEMRAVRYRQYHIAIMKVLNSYCEDVIARSIDEAMMNLTNYRWVYKDFKELAQKIKTDIRTSCGEFVTCSIGIAPNAFLAKLATDLQKPDGLVEITPENIDSVLARLTLTDLPGIAGRNARRLEMIGIRNPLEMRHTSQALLRKAFGGVTGYYWHCRLNFMEVDIYKNDYRGMSATRTVSPEQRKSRQSLESLLISLCTKLEQRLVKQEVFCRNLSFFIRYKDFTGWDTNIRFMQPVQDGLEMRNYIMDRVQEHERAHNISTMFHENTRSIGVAISDFVTDQHVQYSLFDNKINKDRVRKIMYAIKDRFGKNSVRKAVETISPNEMKDAIGFGSIKDLYDDKHFNQYMLEE